MSSELDLDDCASLSPKAKRELEALRRAAYVIAMRVLQSDLVLDDEEIAALDLFIAQQKPR